MDVMIAVTYGDKREKSGDVSARSEALANNIERSSSSRRSGGMRRGPGGGRFVHNGTVYNSGSRVAPLQSAGVSGVHTSALVVDNVTVSGIAVEEGAGGGGRRDTET